MLVEGLEERLVPSSWFVSTSGSDANPGTPNAPFFSIQHAVNVAQNGDRIHVAQGIYGYNPAADRITDDARFNSGNPNDFRTISGTILQISPAAVLVYDKALQIYGGFNSNFTSWAPSTYRTIISGGAALRCVYVQANQVDINFDMEGFSIESGHATGEAALQAPDNINGFGAGMWINAAARRNSGTPGTYILKNMVFRGNLAVGTNTGDSGGAAAGSALALRFVPNMIMDHVTFDTNLSQAGTGVTRGGAAFGAVQLGNSNLTGSNITFYNNRAVAGDSSGAGIDASGATADALGGGFSEVDSNASLTDVIALNNSLAGGSNGNGDPGSAFGGAMYAERSSLNLNNVDIRHSVIQGGAGKNADGRGGLAGGGGIASANSNLNLNQVQVIDNNLTGGNGVVVAGSPGGGGVWAVRTGSNATLGVTITNTVVADNVVSFSGTGNTNIGGGGGGIWLQGVDANITQSTIANNRFGPGLFNGQAIVLLNGNNADASPHGATATIANSIIADHTNSNGAAALTVLSQSPNNVVTLNQVLYANNSKDDNSNGLPTPAGVFNGLNTVIRAANAFFTSPGGPNFDYSIASNSPAVGRAAGSNVTVDIENNPRTGTPDLGAYQHPAPARAHTSVALFDPETAIWQLRNSNAGGFFPDGPVFAYGTGGGNSKPVVGDWNGKGISTIGIVEVKAFDFNGKPFYVDPTSGQAVPVSVFELRTSNGPGGPDIIVAYGSFSATPVVGNWNNNAQHIDHIGVVEIQPGGVAAWKLRNSFTAGPPDITVNYGGVTSIPVVGHWTRNSGTSIGVVENVGGVLTWSLRSSISAGPPDAGRFGYGLVPSQPLVGDWNNTGVTGVGVYDPTNALWQLRNEVTPGAPDAGSFVFGPVGANTANPFAENWIALSGNFSGA